MRKFQFLEEKEYQTFELSNGKMVNVYACKYDCKVNLENESFILSSDKEEYESSNLPKMEETNAKRDRRVNAIIRQMNHFYAVMADK